MGGGKGLHKVFKYILNQLNNSFSTLLYSGSEVSYFIIEPRNISDVARLPKCVKIIGLNQICNRLKI